MVVFMLIICLGRKMGTIWIIETKGGDKKGKDKNIDIQIEK